MQVYKVLLEGIHPLAAKVVEVGHNPVVHASFVRVGAAHKVGAHVCNVVDLCI